MKNVHLLQTEVYPAKLQLDRDYGTLKILDEPCVINGQDFVGANLYITSNELYTVGWYLDNSNYVTKTTTKQESAWEYQQKWKKIILTTDPRLIKDGVQAIPDVFLEWFVKNPSCEEVETHSLGVKNQLTGESGHYKYEITIPKEKLNQEIDKSKYTIGIDPYDKQETLEETAAKYANKQLNQEFTSKADNFYGFSSSFVEGAKWQQERSYSEEEVENILIEYVKTNPTKPYRVISWFNQFKKSK